MAAFPLQRKRTDPEIVAYVNNPDDPDYLGYEPPLDSYLSVRTLVSKLMRLAFEKKVTYLVEILEVQRESAASQAAYGLALYREAKL